MLKSDKIISFAVSELFWDNRNWICEEGADSSKIRFKRVITCLLNITLVVQFILIDSYELDAVCAPKQYFWIYYCSNYVENFAKVSQLKIVKI